MEILWSDSSASLLTQGCNSMKIFSFGIVFCFCAGSLAAHADSAPFGVLSAYNLVALGSSTITGNITTSSDVEGRVAAANDVISVGGVGATLRGDPWGSLATVNGINYALVAGTAITDTSSFSINCSACSAWAPTSSAQINYNGGGGSKLYSTAPDPINFSTLRTTLQSESAYLSGLTANGSVSGNTLTGTSKTLNIFNLTTAQADNINNMNIVTPAGSTVIINIVNTASNTSFTLNTGMYIDGNSASDTNDDGGDILFNFSGDTAIGINAQFDASILAPYSVLNGGSQMGGNFIVAQVDTTGEVHNEEFQGDLPTPPTVAPEPETLALLGTGLFALACVLHRRKKQASEKV